MSAPAHFICGTCGERQELVSGFILDGKECCRTCHDLAYPSCPACKAPIARKLPKSYSKCGACGSRYFVNSQQQLFDSILLTPDQNEVVKELRYRVTEPLRWGLTEADIARQCMLARGRGTGLAGAVSEMRNQVASQILASLPNEHQRIGTAGVWIGLEAVGFIERAFRGFTINQISPAEVCNHVADLAAEFTQLPSARDVAWRALNTYAVRGFSGLKPPAILRAMAWHLYCEGRECDHLQREAFRLEAKAYARDDVTHVSILAHGCKACQKLDGRKIAIAAFLEAPCLPCAGCNNDEYRCEDSPGSRTSWCSCCITAAFDD